MDNDDDFTFCQVGLPANQDGFEAQKLVPEIGGITIKDEISNGFASNQSSGFLWKDKLPYDTTSKKEETISSLSFNVFDASSSKQSSGLPRQASSENVENSVKVSQEQKTAARKPAPLPYDTTSKKEETIGSLSFNVIDTSSSKQSSGLPRQASSENVENSVKVSQEQKTAARKPAPRAKVPFEKGYSPMDWLKLTRTHPDLAGLKGQSNKRLISMNEVKQHQTEGSMWTVLKGRVYNLSPYMKFHPGGVDMLMKGVGKDCTSLFSILCWTVLLVKCSMFSDVSCCPSLTIGLVFFWENHEFEHPHQPFGTCGLPRRDISWPKLG
ncbi:hypothetical protein L1049_011801 [Liquidambar formosana]|uniref:Cytochrome b5 heme-binding domain-containing protein n=1 Tax=Liquidambar formosana TaxID=63359 RepID=A0AAP0WXA5_LIQFO